MDTMDLTTATTEQLTRLLERIKNELERRASADPALPAGCKIVNLTSGKIGVVTPFHELVVRECKRLAGTWGTITNEGSAWILDATHRPAITDLLMTLFATPLVKKTFIFDATVAMATSPTVDGYKLIIFGSEFTRLQRQDAHAPLQILELVENNLTTGGSRRYPTLHGRVVIRVRCRPDVEAIWEDNQDRFLATEE